MSDFGKLLRSSRFASLAKPLSKNKSKRHPTHQVVETRASALARQEWGLKYALPSKIKSRYITFNDVDNLERLVDFETNGGDLWKRLRFQELGVVPKYEQTGTNPLFERKSNGQKQTSVARDSSFESLLQLEPNAPKKEIKSLVQSLQSLRPEFRAWLLKNDPSLFQSKNRVSPDRFVSLAVTFLKEHEKKDSLNKLESLKKKEGSYSINGFGGLSYGLNGRITNSPNGYIQHKVVPARYLTERNQFKSVALGGFVASANSSSDNQFKIVSSGQTAREVVVPMTVRTATISHDGVVKIDVDPVSISLGDKGRKNHARLSAHARRARNADAINTIQAHEWGKQS